MPIRLNHLTLYILKSQLDTGGRSVGTGLCLSPCLTLLAISISILQHAQDQTDVSTSLSKAPQPLIQLSTQQPWSQRNSELNTPITEFFFPLKFLSLVTALQIIIFDNYI